MGYVRLGIAILLLVLAAIASASATTIQQQLNVNLGFGCTPPFDCDAVANINGNPVIFPPGGPMSGFADFSSVAPGWSFTFQSAPAISFCFSCPDFYDASFGQGGTFTMTGPAGLGLTFNGEVTSGFSNRSPMGVDEFVSATFLGQWSNGQHASGNISIDVSDSPFASLSTSTNSPEPGSVALLSIGIMALATTRVASSLKRKLKG